MQFHKETIMGQVLYQVNEDENNQYYIEQIDELLEDIEEGIHLEEDNIEPWNKNGLVITNRELNEDEVSGTAWIFMETPHVSEYSWLVRELNKIYNPSVEESYRLNTTLGYMMKIYDEKYDDLTDAMRLIAIVSTVFLHPDHMGYDRFVIHPIKLPNFGAEF